MFHSSALEEAAQILTRKDSPESNPQVSNKHSISVISPPETPAALESLSGKSSPIAKKSRMDSTPESEINQDLIDTNSIKSGRLSVISHGAAASHSVSAKYDRQIRIWGDHGQLSLAEGCVYIVGNSMTASEIGKNLSLAGVGSLVYVDTGYLVTKETVSAICREMGHSFSYYLCQSL